MTEETTTIWPGRTKSIAEELDPVRAFVSRFLLSDVIPFSLLAAAAQGNGTPENAAKAASAKAQIERSLALLERGLHKKALDPLAAKDGAT